MDKKFTLQENGFSSSRLQEVIQQLHLQEKWNPPAHLNCCKEPDPEVKKMEEAHLPMTQEWRKITENSRSQIKFKKFQAAYAMKI